MDKVFVTSVSGAQGKAIAEGFVNAGYAVSSMVRAPREGLKHFNITVGQYDDTEILAAAMKGSEAIVLTLPLIFDSAEVVNITENIVTAAKQAQVGKIIFNSSIPLGNNKTGYAAIDVKHDALDVLENSGLEVITLMPTIYLDNLASDFLLPVIQTNHVIPYPIAIDNEFAWISYENLGRYCIAAINNEDIVGARILISNLDQVTKPQLAERISSVAQRDIHYIPTSPDEFEENLRGVLGDYVAQEIANLYRGVEKNSNDFRAYSNQEFLQSVNLQSTDDWVKSIQW